MGVANEGTAHRKLRIATVVDDFTSACLAPEATVLPLHSRLWRAQLLGFRPDLVFVESAWRGWRGSWRGQVASYPRSRNRALARLTAACRRRGIPTAFWNKEDPVHFERFIHSAKQFDYIFTTEEELLGEYQKQASLSSDRVNLLMFAAQPTLHYPGGGANKKDVVCFAGSYGEPEFVERRADCEMLLDAASDTDLRILDRNSEDPTSDKAFPLRYRRYLRPAVDYNTLANLQREYKVFLNVNTVRNSRTMCSRRVFELLASGASVVSGPGRAADELFGHCISVVDNVGDARTAIHRDLQDDTYRLSRAATGLRKVMLEHTYRHRLAEICRTIGLPARPNAPDVTLFAFVRSAKQADRLVELKQRDEGLGIATVVAVVGHDGDATRDLEGRLRENLGEHTITCRVPPEREKRSLVRSLASRIVTPHVACVVTDRDLPDSLLGNLAARLQFTAGSAVDPIPLCDADLIGATREVINLGAIRLTHDLFTAVGWSDDRAAWADLEAAYRRLEPQ